ncbi:HAD family hydrolase [Pseudodesulfovibrio pelocollis]|uniref:HAD family hydrolase n=1 Tax=Pseudodesulfovibrio pelocollis TaxID=3051432 RepID=UPI00255B3B34|nr:HAD family hydrolase [Pseudodesulfovibrio sp. SB368]
MNRLDAIVFDFDGTLAELTLDFDLMKRKIAALGEVFLGERPEPDGTPALEWLDQLVARAMEMDRDEGLEFASRGRLVLAATELDAAREGRLFAFTRPALALLRDRGVATGVITRNISAAVRLVFPDIDAEVGAFVAREAAVRVKPDPAHLMQVLERLGADPARTLMVGDHPMDVETGRRAGALCAAVTSGHQGADAFAALKPDFIAPDVAALLPLLDEAGLI